MHGRAGCTRGPRPKQAAVPSRFGKGCCSVLCNRPAPPRTAELSRRALLFTWNTSGRRLRVGHTPRLRNFSTEPGPQPRVIHSVVPDLHPVGPPNRRAREPGPQEKSASSESPLPHNSAQRFQRVWHAVMSSSSESPHRHVPRRHVPHAIMPPTPSCPLRHHVPIPSCPLCLTVRQDEGPP